MDTPVFDLLMKQFPDFKTLEQQCKEGVSISNFYDREKLLTLMAYYQIMESEEDDMEISIFLSEIRARKSIKKSLEYLISNFSKYVIIQENEEVLKVYHNETKKVRCVEFVLYRTWSLRGIGIKGIIILLDLDEASYEMRECVIKHVITPAIVVKIPIYKLDVGKDPTVGKPDPFDTKTMVKLTIF